ncbi:MAG: hypothetical protein ACE10H_12975, partial [Candidatus Binatia bacterium]
FVLFVVIFLSRYNPALSLCERSVSAVLLSSEQTFLAANPVPRTYIRGFAARSFGVVQNIHSHTHVRGALWYGANGVWNFSLLFATLLEGRPFPH